MPPNLPKKKVYHLINEALCLKVFIGRLEGEVMNLMQKKKKDSHSISKANLFNPCAWNDRGAANYANIVVQLLY